jgi:hypothetical protein
MRSNIPPKGVVRRCAKTHLRGPARTCARTSTETAVAACPHLKGAPCAGDDTSLGNHLSSALKNPYFLGSLETPLRRSKHPPAGPSDLRETGQTQGDFTGPTCAKPKQHGGISRLAEKIMTNLIWQFGARKVRPDADPLRWDHPRTEHLAECSWANLTARRPAHQPSPGPGGKRQPLETTEGGPNLDYSTVSLHRPTAGT